ncbi:hypothetical protein OLO36_27845, partial [Klebsiella pneumoniae]|nr:hypothetical protein [Klebsiella pneumoniae]
MSHFLAIYPCLFDRTSVKRTAISPFPEDMLLKRRLFIAASLLTMSFSPAYASDAVSFAPQ